MDAIICITGMPGSGKTEVAGILKKRGFLIFEMSGVVKRLMAKEGIAIDNVSIRRFSADLRKRHGKDFVARETIKEISKMRRKKLVIVGSRSTYEISLFRKRMPGIFVLDISAPSAVRFNRMVKRGRDDDPKVMKDFEYREHVEAGYGIISAGKDADYILANTGTTSDLRKNVDEFLGKIRKNKGKVRNKRR